MASGWGRNRPSDSSMDGARKVETALTSRRWSSETGMLDEEDRFTCPARINRKQAGAAMSSGLRREGS